MSNYDVKNNFEYHEAGNNKGRLVEIRKAAQLLAETIIQQAPEGAEQTLALRKVEEAVSWADSAILRAKAKPAKEQGQKAA